MTPRFSFNRRNLWLIRLLSSWMPIARIPGDIQVENRCIPSHDPRHPVRLRIYWPKTIVSPAPALLWMHGGGYIIGTPEMSDRLLCRFTRELGITIVSVDYRLAPEHPFPIPLEDCYSALKWVFAQGPAAGIDPDRVATGGESAGGGLAAALAQLARDRSEVSPIFQMLVYPMLDDRSAVRANLPYTELLTWTQESNRFGWESYLHQKCGAEHVPPYAVPSRRDDLNGLPPAWIAVGTLDLFYEENVAYAQRLSSCGVDCELVVIPGAFHGFDVYGPRQKFVADFRKSQLAALKKHLFP